jgi:hypothetical protein
MCIINVVVPKKEKEPFLPILPSVEPDSSHKIMQMTLSARHQYLVSKRKPSPHYNFPKTPLPFADRHSTSLIPRPQRTLNKPKHRHKRIAHRRPLVRAIRVLLLMLMLVLMVSLAIIIPPVD